MLMLTNTLETFAQAVIAGIRDNIRNKKVTPFGAAHATGDAENSLFYRITDKGLIIGSTWAYITVLEDGRKPGKFAPPDVVEKWIEDKPIKSDINKKSLAFLINRSIAEKGSLLYRQGGHSGVLSDFLNADYIHRNLTLVFKEQIVTEITGLLFKTKAA